MVQQGMVNQSARARLIVVLSDQQAIPLGHDALFGDDNLQLAANNLVGVNCLPTAGANVYDLLAADQVLITKDAAEALEVRFGLREASGE